MKAACLLLALISSVTVLRAEPLDATPMRYAETAAAVAVADPARATKFRSLVPELDRLFADVATKNDYPGLGVGIVLDGEVVYARGFGDRDLAAKAPFDEDTVFPIASVTKAFVTMAVLKLRDAGRLSLDEPAARYYPPLARLAYPTRDSPPVTVRQLMTHGSGLPEDNYWIDAAGAVTEESLARLVDSGMSFSSAPDTRFEYSNTAYAILGKIIEHVSGRPATAYVSAEILAPLGMSATVWDPAAVPAAHAAVGYRGLDGYRGQDTSKNPAPVSGLGVMDPAGGLRSSIRDMTRYVAFHLAAWPPRDEVEAGPLRRSSVRELHLGSRPVDSHAFPNALLPSREPALVRVRDSGPSLNVASYGYGLFVRKTCEDSFQIDHSGGLPGYTTLMTLLPERGYGIVAFVNDERVPGDPIGDATKLLRNKGVIDVLPHPAVPALDTMRAAVDRLLARWDAASARTLFDPTFWSYQSIETFQAQLAKLGTAHGSCRPESGLEVENHTRGRWRLACERGSITFVMALSPQKTPRLQTLLWEGSLPPTEALQRSALAAAALVARWDEKRATRLLAGHVDVRQTRKRLARIGVEHGACKLGEPLASDGATTARFRLACDDGAVELGLTLDAKTGRVTEITSERPRTSPNCR